MDEDQHDYAAAAQLLETVPVELRDATFYKDVCAKRDRVAQLDQEIQDDKKQKRLKGLRPKVEELAKLQPQRKDLQTLLKMLAQQTELAKEIINSIGMKLVLVPAGKFTMGSPKTEEGLESEGPQHELEITEPFYMGVFEVTQGQYRQVMKTNPSWFSKEGDGSAKVTGLDTADFPVDTVSWYDAMEFCKRLSELPEEKAKKRAYTLPTEAQWEYACRGGPLSMQDPFHYGKSLSSPQANFDSNYPYGGADKGIYKGRTEKVGSYPPNRLGLHDMHGNVWEWCLDWYDANYYKTSPPKDPCNNQIGENRRVVRGGSWHGSGWYCRAALRIRFRPDGRSSDTGFRVVCAIASKTP
jgi:formylglycine-generating enzyme required for sulfatase activity